MSLVVILESWLPHFGCWWMLSLLWIFILNLAYVVQINVIFCQSNSLYFIKWEKGRHFLMHFYFIFGLVKKLRLIELILKIKSIFLREHVLFNLYFVVQSLYFMCILNLYLKNYLSFPMTFWILFNTTYLFCIYICLKWNK